MALKSNGEMVLRGIAQGLVGAMICPLGIIAFASILVSGNHSDAVAITHLCVVSTYCV